MDKTKNNNFNAPVTQLIRERISVRSYKSQQLTNEFKNKINDYIARLNGPFNATVRFKLIDSNLLKDNSNIKLGTYGMIRGATSFILSSVDKSDMNLEQLGYEFEELILFAQSLGLGTCWLGGTFKKAEFAKAMELNYGEIMPTVSPIGYPSEGKNIFDSLVRLAAGSKNRKNFEEIFYNDSFEAPLTENNADIYSIPLEMVRLAPSASNKQPWRIVKANEVFHFYLCHTKGYSASLGFDMQRIDMGIAMCHFDLALKEMGIDGSFKKLNPSIKTLNENTEYIISWAK